MLVSASNPAQRRTEPAKHALSFAPHLQSHTTPIASTHSRNEASAGAWKYPPQRTQTRHAHPKFWQVLLVGIVIVLAVIEFHNWAESFRAQRASLELIDP